MTTVIIEKLGRKILLLISDAFICISMIGVAVFFKLKESCGEECQNGDAAVFVEKTTVDDIGFLPLVNNSLVIILNIVTSTTLEENVNNEKLRIEIEKTLNTHSGQPSDLCNCLLDWLWSNSMGLEC